MQLCLYNFTVYFPTCRYRLCEAQNGSADCGLFALAFASVLASGKHPSSHHFDHQRMRAHLHACLTTGTFSAFPVLRVGRENKKKIKMCHDFPVYCSCRMPASFGDRMIQCNNCHKWFHLELCIKVKEDILKSKWFCDKCL